MERAVLVSIEIKSERRRWRMEDVSSELEELVSSAGVGIAGHLVCVCEKPSAAYLVGRGKVEEIALLSADENADTVIFSHDLSGTQQRNLEGVIGRKTIDRTQLILDIFSKRAKSPEGKTQVELALLEYLLPRLTGKGIMLSRLGGGIGTRGPGETKLEVDRRQVRKRIGKLKSDLESFRSHRRTINKRRKNSCLPLVALIGYTSAGKSTLLNRLTGSSQPVSEKLFTTLDPLSKALRLENGQDVIISDTVGFLHELPHHLIEAFKATLEEVKEADLLIYVLDISDQRVHEHEESVREVLDELGLSDKPFLTALNKVDLVCDRSWLELQKNEFAEAVVLSAKTGENMEGLIRRMGEYFSGMIADLKVLVPHSSMKLVDILYRQARIDKIDYLEEGVSISLRMPRSLFEQLNRHGEMRIIC
ncbi:MAG: GTPase HflX [Candidatus Omnitrophota bacterium]